MQIKKFLFILNFEQKGLGECYHIVGLESTHVHLYEGLRFEFKPSIDIKKMIVQKFVHSGRVKLACINLGSNPVLGNDLSRPCTISQAPITARRNSGSTRYHKTWVFVQYLPLGKEEAIIEKLKTRNDLFELGSIPIKVSYKASASVTYDSGVVTMINSFLISTIIEFTI